MNQMIIFKGNILPGFDLNTVKEEFARLERLPREVADSIFIGRPFVLRDQLTDTDISDYYPALASIGMDVVMEGSVPEGALSFAMVRQKYLQSIGSSVAAAGYPANTQATSYDGDIMPIPKVFSFDFSGRFGRLNYINASLIMGAILLLPSSILFGIMILFATQEMIAVVVLVGLVLLVYTVFVAVLGSRLTVLRLHDLNKTGWLVLAIIFGGAILSIIPFLSIIPMVVNILLLAMPGTIGVNNYGPPTKQGHIAGLIIMGVLIVLSVIATIIAITVFSLFAAAGSNYYY